MGWIDWGASLWKKAKEYFGDSIHKGLGWLGGKVINSSEGPVKRGVKDWLAYEGDMKYREGQKRNEIPIPGQDQEQLPGSWGGWGGGETPMQIPEEEDVFYDAEE